MIKNSIASNPAMAPMKDKIDDMSVDEIGKMLNMKFKSFQEEDDNGKKVIYVDVRPNAVSDEADRNDECQRYPEVQRRNRKENE